MQGAYPGSLALVKLSVLTFYLRLFPHENFRRLCYVFMAMVIAIGVSTSFCMLFGCSPVSSGWKGPERDSDCIDRTDLQYASGCINLVNDVMILLLPIKYIWRSSPPPSSAVQSR